MASNVVSLFPTLPIEAQQFVRFWYRYPKKVAKLDAQRAWMRLSTTDRRECLERLEVFIRYWQESGTERRFIPHPATFLNGRRWEDEIEGMEAPVMDLGQCHWNRNGNREPGAGQCEARATHSNPTNGFVYCDKHAATLGIFRKKVG